jgi:hypothetical protein
MWHIQGRPFWLDLWRYLELMITLTSSNPDKGRGKLLVKEKAILLIVVSRLGVEVEGLKIVASKVDSAALPDELTPEIPMTIVDFLGKGIPMIEEDIESCGEAEGEGMKPILGLACKMISEPTWRFEFEDILQETNNIIHSLIHSLLLLRTYSVQR